MGAVDMNALLGRTVLWIGNECQGWSLPEFVRAAKLARMLGFDSICPKRANGEVRWYGTPAHLTEEREVVIAQGCGFIPFGYCYGPKFGARQIRDECAILREMAEANRDEQGNAVVQADMEAEWNGQVWAAQLFESIMRPWPGLLSVSTWADPNLQDWDGVALALAPCVNAWTPQRYTDWLAHQPLPPEETIVQPGVDMTGEFGVNHPLIIAHGQPCVFAWEYQSALANPGLSNALTKRAV